MYGTLFCFTFTESTVESHYIYIKLNNTLTGERDFLRTLKTGNLRVTRGTQRKNRTNDGHSDDIRKSSFPTKTQIHEYVIQ